MTILAASAVRPDCTAVTVTYDSEPHIDELLGSLDASSVALRVVVVDNGSRDASVNLARSRPGVTVLATGVNGGYAAGINVGRRYADPERPVLVVNPDLRFRPGAVEALLATLVDPAVGIAVPRLVDTDGHLRRSLRREPTVRRELGEALFGDRVASRPGWSSEIIRSDDQYGCDVDVDWATGAAMMISPAGDRAIAAWDESYFLYSEEVDAAARVRAAGLRIRYVADATAEHDGGGSGTSERLVALQAVNRVRYFERRHGALHSAIYRGTVALHELSRAADPARRSAAVAVLRRRRWSGLARPAP